jgi:hypothetical protein
MPGARKDKMIAHARTLPAASSPSAQPQRCRMATSSFRARIARNLFLGPSPSGNYSRGETVGHSGISPIRDTRSEPRELPRLRTRAHPGRGPTTRLRATTWIKEMSKRCVTRRADRRILRRRCSRPARFGVGRQVRTPLSVRSWRSAEMSTPGSPQAAKSRGRRRPHSNKTLCPGFAVRKHVAKRAIAL